MSEQHIYKKGKSGKRIIERKKLEQVVMNKYTAIWSHSSTSNIIKLYSRISDLIASLEEKSIPYEDDLKSAMKFSIFENAELNMSLDDFKKFIETIDMCRLRHVNEDFDIIFMWIDDGHCSRNLHDFIADKSYALASYGKPKPACGYDPDFRGSGNLAIRHNKHRVVDDE